VSITLTVTSRDCVQNKESIFSLTFIGLVVLMAGVFGLSLPLSASSHAKSDVIQLGIMDPDDRKHTVALPAETATGISRQLAAKYPRKSIEGVIFYMLSSWRDTANLVLEAHAQQGALMVDLINRIDRIKRTGPDRKLTRQVTALENRLNESLDSGYR
jgi:hypothetical protein